MLLKKEKPAQIDYLENWPEHYYEIENAKERKEILAQAISRGLDLPNDNYRMKLLEKRYGKDGKNDATMEMYERLVDFARRKGIVIVNDNPYSFILNDRPLSILSVPGAKDCCIEFNSMSKSHNMPGCFIFCLMLIKPLTIIIRGKIF